MGDFFLGQDDRKGIGTKMEMSQEGDFLNKGQEDYRTSKKKLRRLSSNVERKFYALSS